MCIPNYNLSELREERAHVHCVSKKYALALRCLKSKIVLIFRATSDPNGGTEHMPEPVRLGAK